MKNTTSNMVDYTLPLFFNEIRNLSFVPRWTTARLNQPQSVAEHSYYVSLYAGILSKHVWGHNKSQFACVLSKALLHDIEELAVGDMPSPVKSWLSVPLKNKFGEFVMKKIKKCLGFNVLDLLYTLDAETEKESCEIVKIADVMDEVAFLAIQIQAGNEPLSPFLHYSFKKLVERVESSDKMRSYFSSDNEKDGWHRFCEEFKQQHLQDPRASEFYDNR